MKTLSLSFSLLLLLCLVATQDFSGGYIKHLQTGTLTAIVDQLAVTKVSASYSQIFSRIDTFDSTDTEFFIGTSLKDYHAGSPIVLASPKDSALHIQILNPRINPGKNILTVNIDTLPSVINVTPQRVPVYLVRLYYIVVGSGFKGYYGAPVESSFLFARNGRLNLMTTGLYDFSNTNSPSPFNYLYDPAVNVGCGAVKRDSKWILEFSSNCQYMKMFIFITGFEFIHVPGTNIVADIKFSYNTEFTSANPGLFTNMININNALDGVTITNQGNVQSVSPRVQFSVIAFSLQEYDAVSYPIQLVHPDTYKINTIDSINFGNSYILGVPPGTGTINPSVFPVPGPAFYYDVTPNEVSHLICGDSQQHIQMTAATVPQINFSLGDVNVETLGLPYEVIGPATLTNFALNFERSCIMFTGITDVCSEVAHVPPIDTSVQFVTVSDNAVNVGTQFFTSIPPVLQTYSPNKDAQYITELAQELLIIEQTFNQPGTISYKFNYGPNVDKGKAYEGIFHLSSSSFPIGVLAGNPVQYTFTVKIQIFGNIVYRRTLPLNSQAITIHFGFINSVNSNSDVTITYSTNINYDSTYALLIPYINYIEFGIVEHSQVIDSQNICRATCDPIQTSSNTYGIDYTSIPPKCVTCNSDLNLVFRPDLGSCGCGIGRVQSNGVCEACNIPLCATCTIPSGQCTMCVEHAAYINSALPTQGCACITHYYRSDISCLQCPAGCVTCTSPTSCSTCVINNNTRSSNNTGCACLPGFYENGNAVCPHCAPQCLTCQDSATNCQSCNTLLNFVKQGSTCVCKEGFFKVIHSNGTATCQPCISSCKRCAGKADQCMECFPLWVRGSDNKCSCKSGYIEYNGNCIDSLCTSIPNCQTCLILVNTGATVCKQCVGLRVPSNDSTRCVCKQGYFEKAGQCVKCGNGCKQCVSATECKTCANQAYPLGDGTCQCPTGNFVAEINNQLRCQLCDANCLRCVDSPSNCLECQNGFVSVNRKCQCPARYYPSMDNFQCLSCGTGCSSCSSGAKCDACEPGYNALDNKCVLNCPTGTFNAGDSCHQCSDNCTHCVSSISCSGCFPEFKLFAGSCRLACPEGTFTIGSICVACRQPCATCNVNSESCLSCVSGYFLSNGKCISDCPEKTYFSNNTCKSCSSNCFNCVNSASNCVSCPDGKFLVNGECKDSCPYVVIDGQCSNNCPSGYYLDGKSCRVCQGSCATCSSATQCVTCVNNLLVYKGQCVSSCPANTLKLDNYCLDCDASCVGCSGSPFACLRCQSGYYQLKDRCVKECPASYYIDYSSGSCKQCDAGCKKCVKPGQCVQCDDGTIPATGLCPNSCGANCISCKDGACQVCTSGFILAQGKCQSFCPTGSSVVGGNCVCNTGYLHQNQCVATCPDGFAPENKACVACKAPCKTCSGSAYQCTGCLEGFKLDQVSKKCVANVQCPYGYYASNLGGCRLICPLNFYFHDSTCYENGCPLGYVPNEDSRSCEQQDIPTGCTTPYFLQGSSCVKSCQSGFYANSANRICQPCSPNCYTCTELKVCVACASGFSLKGNECVATTSCPSGYFKYADTCVTKCPIGTSAENGFCTRLCRASSYYYNYRCYTTCPTLYRTADACVEQCPSNYILQGKICIAPAINCAANQFYDSLSNSCANCRSPCATCSGAANKCLSCLNNYYLSNNACFPNSNVVCPAKCSACNEPNKCLGCASGYVNTGDDCVKNLNVLQEVKLQEISKSVRSRTVFIRVRPTVLPNGLPSSLASQFFIISPNQAFSGSTTTNQWISGSDVYVAITFEKVVPSTIIYLVTNAPKLSELYLSMGYKLTNSYLQVSISPALQLAPSDMVIPITASTISQERIGESFRQYSVALNQVVAKAIRY